MMPLFSSPLSPFGLVWGTLLSVPVSLVPSRASFDTFLAVVANIFADANPRIRYSLAG